MRHKDIMRTLSLFAAALAYTPTVHAEPAKLDPVEIQIEPGGVRGATTPAPGLEPLARHMTVRTAISDLGSLLNLMHIPAQTRQRLGVSASANPCHTAHLPHFRQCVAKVQQNVAYLPAADRAVLDAELAALKTTLDGMSEQSESDPRQMQAAQDHAEKAGEILRDVLKNMPDIRSGATQHPK